MIREIKFNSSRNFGVEFEFNSPNNERMTEFMNSIGQECLFSRYSHQENNTQWVAKTDSSCGYELVTPVLTGWRGIIDLGEVVSEIKNSRLFRFNKRCGLHVHINVHDFNHNQLINLIAWWIKVEHIFFALLPLHRRDNSYCQYINRFMRFSHNGEYDYNQLWLHGRGALNLQHISDNSSSRIEFRLGCMSTDPNVIKNWIRILMHFVEICKNMPPPKNVKWFSVKQFFRFMDLSNDKSGNITKNFSPIMVEMRNFIINKIKENNDINYEKIRNEITAIEQETLNVTES